MNAQSTKKIAVIGAGSWGTALSISLAKNGVSVRLWGRNKDLMQHMQAERENTRYLPACPLPSQIHCFHDLAEATDGVDDWLLVVPSSAFSDTLEQLQSLHPDKTPRISWASKGLDPVSQRFLDETVKRYFPKSPLAVLSGPSFAIEVAQSCPTAVVVAGTESSWVQDLIALFHADRFRVYENTDMIGVELCAALKNVLAIAAGISDGMQLGSNARAALLTRGMVEMRRLAAYFGAKPETLMGLAGLGDLMLTAMDDRSRNRRFGLALGRGQSVEEARGGIDQVVEGMVACRIVHDIMQAQSLSLPITEQVYAICYESRSPAEALNFLMNREPGKEASSS